MDVDGYEPFRILLFVILLLINGLMTWDMGINWLDLMIAETANDTIFEHFYGTCDTQLIFVVMFVPYVLSISDYLLWPRDYNFLCC
jgi:hypothetical protein